MRVIRLINKRIRGKTFIIVGVGFLLLLVAGFMLKENLNNSQKNTPDNTQSTDQESAEDSKSATDSSSSAAPTNKKPNNSPNTSVAFSVSGLTLHNPEVIYNQDRFGNSYKACKVEADITVTSGGEVTYYWDSYHPEYFNPSFKNGEEKLVFNSKGTKTVKLDTYASDDNRRFSIFIVKPNSMSKVTSTQVWCAKS